MQRSERIKSLATLSQFRIGALLVLPDRLLIVLDGCEIPLEPRVMEVLVALAEHAGEVVSAEQLLIEVWRGTFYGDNPVHKAIAHLRRLVGDDSRAPHFIETIRKRGYRLIAKVSFPDHYRRASIQTSAWSNRSPFVGLSAFDHDHAEVFFGRSRMTAEVLSAMRAQLDNQRRLVLIVGASGCGKTSLLRAGAMPLLRQPGGFDGLAALSLACCDLAAAQGNDVIALLGSAVAQWTLGDRPVLAPLSPSDQALALAQPGAIMHSIEEAFRRHPTRALEEQPHAHLLLVIDHAEALVATPSISDAERAEFSQLIQALCDSPRVLVVMITRSDFYPKLMQALPELAELKAGDGHVDVFVPRRGEFAQIIRTPALLAGLSFEEDPHTLLRLDDVLRDAACEQPDALPLLQHTLQALYERRGPSGQLSFQAYREIGGLEGALSLRAEAVFAALPADAQRGLDLALSQLIVIQPDSAAISARRVSGSALGDAAAHLVEAFIQARLFVGELHDGLPAFGVAHESLLRQWPRARDWAQDNRRLLQARTRLGRATQRWIEEGRRADHLLNSGRPLSEAQEVMQFAAGDLVPDEHEFLRVSARLHSRKRWLRVGASVALALLTLASSVLTVIAMRSRDEAEARRAEAQHLADFMLGDLADNLRPLGNLKLLDSIGAQALSALKRRPLAEMGTEDLINHARALVTIGEVMVEQAKLAEAATAFKRADAAAHMALAQAPSLVDALQISGLTAYSLGALDYRANRFDDAERKWLRYLDMSERLQRLQPLETKWQVELSYALNNLGTVARKRGRIPEALVFFNRSAVLKKAVAADQPDDTKLRFELIDTLSWISSGDQFLGRLRLAAAGYAEVTAMLRVLVAGAPENRAWERRLANYLLLSTILEVARGHPEQAKVWIDESVARLSKLTQQEPGQQVWRRDLAHALLQSSDVERLLGIPEFSRIRLRDALRLTTNLLTMPNVPPEWRQLDAQIRAKLALLENDHIAINQAITDLALRQAQSPENLDDRTALAKALIWRGQLELSGGQLALARNDAARVKALLANIASDSQDFNVLAPWISAHRLLGEYTVIADRAEFLEDNGYLEPDYLALRRATQQQAPE